MTNKDNISGVRRRTILKALGTAGAVGVAVGGTAGSAATQEIRPGCCASSTVLTEKAYAESALDLSRSVFATVDGFSGPITVLDPDTCGSTLTYDRYDVLVASSLDNCSGSTAESVLVPPGVSVPVGEAVEISGVSSCPNSSFDQIAISACTATAPPTAVDDAYAATEDTTLVVPAPGVLENDSDPDGTFLAAQLVSGPPNGSVLLEADGSFTYTPNQNFNGIDTFEYEALDAFGVADAAIVNITVAPIDDPPVTGADSYTTPEDTPLEVDAPGVLGNDSDPDGDQLTARLVSDAVNGSVDLQPDGAFTYTPTPDFNGDDSFAYEATDGNTAVPATVDLTVTPVNDPPVAVDDSYSTDQGTDLFVPAPGVLDNDSDPDGDELTARLVIPPADGSVVLNPDGSFTHTPNPGFSGTDSFEYEVDDGNDGTDTATVTITVIPTGPFLRLPDGLRCPDIDQWTLQIQGNGPIDSGSTVCGRDCDSFRVTIKPPKGGRSRKTELCGTDLNNLSGQKYEIEACADCSTPNYAGVTLREIRNRSA